MQNGRIPWGTIFRLGHITYTRKLQYIDRVNLALVRLIEYGWQLFKFVNHDPRSLMFYGSFGSYLIVS